MCVSTRMAKTLTWWMFMLRVFARRREVRETREREEGLICI
jgi:hypothetical protein